MPNVASEQDADDQPGRDHRRPQLRLDLPPRSVRPSLDRGIHERRRAFGGRGGVEPVADPADEVVVPRISLVQHPQPHRDRGPLAPWTSSVWLDPLSESTIAVAVGGDGVAHGPGLSIPEQALEPAPVEYACVAGKE